MTLVCAQVGIRYYSAILGSRHVLERQTACSTCSRRAGAAGREREPVKSVRVILMLFLVCAGTPWRAAAQGRAQDDVPRMPMPSQLSPASATFLGGVPFGTVTS